MLNTLSHMITMIAYTSTESIVLQTEVFTEFEVPCKVEIGKIVK